MTDFLFAVGQRVKERPSGEVGIIVDLGTYSASNRYYSVRFDNGKTRKVSEKDLLPAK